ncbi:hypothetical protein AAE02nite_26100 [Adhaeribacter aerolatus]|uniref:Uncharacterized protein n=1 Tax=Adhaeribacter aerolatus TaxID=670289 RepID=A0A512AZ28_9BACT|nr:DUF6686 family protein [Adhaeribacter aerolatus]GEO04946.1 hypothetical protein AAE02nite_26100 [Adhaeribacter aerolatus]
MCEVKRLYQNNFGEISQCGCSARIQLNFGNFVLGLSETELEVLQGYSPPLYEQEKEAGRPTNERNIYLSPSVYHLMLAFSLEELAGLMDLINQASIVLQIQKILKEN